VVEVLGVPEGRNAPIFPRIIDERVVEGYPVEKLYFFSAPDIAVTGVMIHPRGVATPVQTDLVLLEHGAKDIPAERPRLEALLRQHHQVLVFDVRNIGAVEGRPVHSLGSSYVFDTNFRLGCDAMMLGISLLGLQVFDALRGYDYLRTRADVSERIGLVGVGRRALAAYYAAVLEEGFCELTVSEMLVSYRDIVETRDFNRRCYDMDIMAWGMLPGCDLPDVAPCLAPRPVTFTNPRDAYGAPASAAHFQARYLDPARRAGAPADWRPAVTAPGEAVLTNR
jgi:hypothetical protein